MVRRLVDDYAEAGFDGHIMLGLTIVTAPAWLPLYLLGRLFAWAVRRD